MEAARSHPAVAVAEHEDLVPAIINGSPYGGAAAVHNHSPLDGSFPGKLEEKCADVSARNGCASDAALLAARNTCQTARPPSCLLQTPCLAPQASGRGLSM